jgi:hypothetical protein
MTTLTIDSWLLVWQEDNPEKLINPGALLVNSIYREEF